MLPMKHQDFRYRQFLPTIILQCMRWYLRYPLSYRNLEEMMEERGVDVDHTTLYRWVQKYAPELEKRIRWHARTFCRSCHLDETYLRVKGKWKYLYRAIDKNGGTIDFMISSKHNYQAAYIFLKNALKKTRVNKRPLKITTDKHPCYGPATQALKKEKLLKPHVEDRQARYLNNVIASDHRRIKRRTRPMRGFKSLGSAKRVIKGIEAMNMIVKKQSCFFADSIHDQIYFIYRIFNIHTPTLSKI